MLKKCITCLFTLLIVFTLVGCFKSMGGPAAKGQAVIDHLTISKYQEWPLWPGTEKLYKGSRPHGSFLTTYVSQGAFDAIEAKAGKIPYGEFIIKENYTGEKKLAAITVMFKRKGYDANAGDWFWMKYSPDGKIAKEGKVAGCINCHMSVVENDWLFTGSLY